MELPKFVKVEWYTGDVTYEKPIDDHGEYYIFDVHLNGSYWAHKSWCTPLDEIPETIHKQLTITVSNKPLS